MSLQIEIDFKNNFLDGFEDKYPNELERARAWARHYCYSNKGFKKYGALTGWMTNTVTSDDVRDLLDTETMHDEDIGKNNWHGSIFRVKYFTPTGIFYASEADGAHGRPIMIWRFLEDVYNKMQCL